MVRETLSKVLIETSVLLTARSSAMVAISILFIIWSTIPPLRNWQFRVDVRLALRAVHDARGVGMEGESARVITNDFLG